MDKRFYNSGTYPAYTFNGQTSNFVFVNPGNYQISLSSQTPATSYTFYSTTESTTNLLLPNSQTTETAPGVKMNQSSGFGFQNQNRPSVGDSFAMPPAAPNSPARFSQSFPTSSCLGRPIPLRGPSVQGSMYRGSSPAGSDRGNKSD